MIYCKSDIKALALEEAAAAAEIEVEKIRQEIVASMPGSVQHARAVNEWMGAARVLAAIRALINEESKL